MNKIEQRVVCKKKCEEVIFTKGCVQRCILDLSSKEYFIEPEKVLVYSPNGVTEIPFVFELMEKFPKKQYYFPKVVKNDLVFYRVQKEEDMNIGKFGILEPCIDMLLQINGKTLILVPAVGIDKKGNRLGRGGGYYDRFLTRILDEAQDAGKKITTVSVIPKCAFVDSVPYNSLDVSMNHVIVI